MFYVYVTVGTDAAESNQVERWRLSDDGTNAVRDRVILDGIPAAPNHDGGRLRFGPDGLLYIGTGDATDPDSAQNPASLAGKILRVTPDGEIPADNPLAGRAAFILGVRNTQGFDWADERTLLVTDHGPSGELGRQGHDEVSVARAGDNLGWPTIFGCQTGPGLVTPVLSWTRAVPPGGAAVYRGQALPGWQGSLLIGTLASRQLHRVEIDRAAAPRVRRHAVYLDGANGPGRLREVYMAPDGALYLTTSNCDGRGSCPPDKDRILRLSL